MGVEHARVPRQRRIFETFSPSREQAFGVSLVRFDRPRDF